MHTYQVNNGRWNERDKEKWATVTAVGCSSVNTVQNEWAKWTEVSVFQ